MEQLLLFKIASYRIILKDIAKIQKVGTIFAMSKDITVQIKGKVVAVEPGKSYTIDKLRI